MFCIFHHILIIKMWCGSVWGETRPYRTKKNFTEHLKFKLLEDKRTWPLTSSVITPKALLFMPLEEEVMMHEHHEFTWSLIWFRVSRRFAMCIANNVYCCLNDCRQFTDVSSHSFGAQNGDDCSCSHLSEATHHFFSL